MPGEVVPEGLDESSPVRSAGLGVEGHVRPGGTIDWLVAFAKPYKRDEEPNVSIVPAGTDISLTSFPSTSYWATFIESLQDDSSRHISFLSC